jgi:hypothetical protein
MHWFFFLTWGWILFFVCTPVFSSQPKGPAPEAVFAQSSFLFEPTLEGQPVRHDFIVHNKGDADLEILKINTA